MDNELLTPRLAWMLHAKESGSISRTCETFSISRKTFYKWRRRYQEANNDSRVLVDRSRKPHTFPRATPQAIKDRLFQLKDETGFGQRLLKRRLAEENISLSERPIWKILKTR